MRQWLLAANGISSRRLGLTLLLSLLLWAGSGCGAGWYMDYGMTRHDLENPDAVPSLSRALEDRRGVVRLQAVRFLSRIGEPARGTVTAIAKLAVSDPDAGVRTMAVEALGVLRADSPVAIDSVVRALDDPNARVRISAITAAGRIGPKAAPALAKVQWFRAHKDPSVRVAAAAAACRISPDTERSAAASTMLAAMHSEDPPLQLQAIEAMRELRLTEEGVLFALGDVADRDPNPHVRERAQAARRYLLAERLIEKPNEHLAQPGDGESYTGTDTTPVPPPPPEPPKPPAGQRVAVVIGVSQYAEQGRWELKNLRYAAKDAEAVSRYLKDPQGGAFDQVYVLVDKDAGTRNIKIHLREKLRGVQERDLVLVFWAGHGTPDPEEPEKLYLVTHDTDPAHLASSGYAMEEFSRDIAAIRARQVLVIADACHSGGISNPKIGVRGPKDNKIVDGIRGIAVVPDPEQPTPGSDQPVRMIFTSSEAGEVSRESEDLGGGHGVFSWFLMQGLRGEADADRISGNHDGVVTLGEVIEYTRDKVKRFTGNQQHPDTAGTFDRNLRLGRVER